MKYLKLKNAPLALLRDDKYPYSGDTDKILWKSLGIDPNKVQKNAVQYTTPDDDVFQFIPIDDLTKFNNYLADFQNDLATLPTHKDRSAEVVDDDRDMWVADMEYNKTETAGLNEQQLRNYQRNKINLEDPVILYKDTLIKMHREEDIAQMLAYQGMLRTRGIEVQWKGKDPDTGGIKRVPLSADEIDYLIAAVFDAGQIVHVQSDTETPVSPWPLEI